MRTPSALTTAELELLFDALMVLQDGCEREIRHELAQSAPDDEWITTHQRKAAAAAALRTKLG